MSQPADATEPAPPPAPRPDQGAWAAWLAFTWLALVVLCAVAELSGWEDLRLALTFSR